MFLKLFDARTCTNCTEFHKKLEIVARPVLLVRPRVSKRARNTVGGMLVPLSLAGESANWQGNNNEPDDTERSQRADEAL